jgi:hypothetical protein
MSGNCRARASKIQVLFSEGHVFHFGTGAEFSAWFICVLGCDTLAFWLKSTGVSEELAICIIWVGNGSSRFLCNVCKLYQAMDVMSQKTEIIFVVIVVRI